MEGKILGVDAAQNQAVITTLTGERIAFAINEWKSQLELVAGMEIDYDLDTSTGQAVNVFPSIKTSSALKRRHINKTRLILMTIFVGGLGAHKFYVGSWGWGIIYIILCLAYIPLILSIVELIHYISLSEEEINKRVQKLDSPFAFLW